MLVTVPSPGSREGMMGLTGMMGLGINCPTYAPYINSYGNCTNVDPNSSPVPVYNTGSAPLAPSPYQNPAGYQPGQIYSDPSIVQAQATAAEQLAASQGVNLKCVLVQNEGTPGFPGLWTTDCRFPGAVNSYDAGLLLQPGGLRIAQTENAQAINSGLPIIQPTWLNTNPFVGTTFENYGLAPSTQVVAAPPTPLTQAQASTLTNQPNQSVPPRDTSVPMATGVPNTGVAFAGGVPNTGAAFAGGLVHQFERFGESSGIGTTGLLIAAAIAAFFLLKR